MTDECGNRPVVLVAHGAPYVPCAQEAALAKIARAVGSLLPAHDVRSATLACPGALDAAVQGLADPIVFPLFMTDGWFVSTNLPKRLKAAGLGDWQVTASLGLDPALPGVTQDRLDAELAQAGIAAGQATLVLLAHGSPSNSNPAQAAYAFSRRIEQSGLFKAISVGFVDESPSLVAAARVDGPAIVLPFFAARAGHMLSDVPMALKDADFQGRVLPPIGLWPEIPHLIAQAIARTDQALVASF